MSDTAEDFIVQDKPQLPETITTNIIYSEPQTDQPDAAEVNIDIVYGNLTAEDLLSNTLFDRILALNDTVKIDRAVALCGVIAVKKHIGKKAFERQFEAYRSQKENAAEVIDSANEPTGTRKHGSETELYSRPYMQFSEDGKKCQVQTFLLHEYIRQDENYIFVRSNARNTVQMYIYRNGVYKHISEGDFKGIILNYLPVSYKKPKIINEVYELFKMDSDKYISIDELNSDENIINFKNGLLHIDSMELTAHTPKIFSTIQLPCNYDKNAQPPSNSVFDKFMEHFTEGDKDKLETLLQFMGVTISNVFGYRAKKALFIIGNGNTGKSQFKGLLDRLIGAENCSSIDICGLEERFCKASLYGKRLAGTSDMSYAGVKSLVVFKQAVTGDLLRAEFKNENDFEFRFRGVFIFCANSMPRFSGDRGSWVYDRMSIITANNIVSQDKIDKFILEKMFAERAYIIRICIEALKRFIKNNYTYHESESARAEMRKYKIENDTALKFISECTEPRTKKIQSDDQFSCRRVYELYKRWSSANYNYSETLDGFIGALEAAGKGKRERVHPGNYYYSDFVPTELFIMEYNQ